MSNENLLPTETEGRTEWRKRLYFKKSTLEKISKAARESLRTDEAMVVWVIEQFFDGVEGKVNTNGQ